MKRWFAVGAIAALSCASSPVRGDSLELGGWLGPRVFSDNSDLGGGTDTPDNLTSALVAGARLGWPLFRGQLVPELELALSMTQTETYEVGVFWLEPRLALRYQLDTRSWLSPFAVVGAGAPVVLSGNTDVVAHDLLGEGFLGAGVLIWPKDSFGLRVEGRLSVLPGDDPSVAVEAELGVGLVLPLGRKARAASRSPQAVADGDHDGVADERDGCLTSPEDRDGVEDDDGCPDIDNDLDGVLDIADACLLQPETYNGFTDDDGCPDAVPPDLASLVGPIGGLGYAPGERLPARSAQQVASIERIAAVLTAHPLVRVRLIGHTDDREASVLAVEGGEADVATLSQELARTRVEAVKELLIQRGLDEARILLEARGAEEPLEDNGPAGGRQKNRRVELQLYVPQR